MTMDDGSSGAFDSMDLRLTRLEGDMAEVKSNIKGLRADMRADIGALRAEIREDRTTLRAELRSDIGVFRDEMRAFREDMRSEFSIMRDQFASFRKELGSVNDQVSYLRGRIEQAPTTLQLLGFIIAIFVASGMTRYFGH